jgi:hypothetical protein
LRHLSIIVVKMRPEDSTTGLACVKRLDGGERGLELRDWEGKSREILEAAASARPIAAEYRSALRKGLGSWDGTMAFPRRGNRGEGEVVMGDGTWKMGVV